jgi:hypothetical protein
MHRTFQTSLIVALVTIAACGDQTGTPTALSPSGQATASKAPPPGPVDVGVTTTVYDADATGALLLMRSDDYNGSGFATYSPSSGRGISGLTSHVSADGSWQLYIGNQTARKLHLMLADAGLSFANGYYSSSVEVASHCFDQTTGASLNIQLLAAGASYDNCSLIVDFDYNTPRATTYKLAMGPNFANTGRAIVTCNAVTGLYCTNWTIEPNDAAANARVAILTAGNGTTSLDGRFYTNSYRVTASK